MNGVDWYGVAALVGALAWLPIIVQWLVQWFSKPDLTIVIGSTAELGYTTNGTILNVEVATRGRRKPALITAIDIDLEHANGRRISLFWSGLNEVLSHAETSTGDQASYTQKPTGHRGAGAARQRGGAAEGAAQRL